MLLPVFIIIDPARAGDVRDIPLPEDVTLAYKINSTSLPLSGEFYKKLFLSNTQHPFCLYLSLEDLADRADEDYRSITDQLISISFHYSYVKLNFDDPLVLFGPRSGETGRYIEIVRNTFIGHGYSNIKPLVIDDNAATLSGDKRTAISFDPQMDPEAALSGYKDMVKNYLRADSSLFLHTDHPERIPDILAEIMKIEKNIQEETPRLYSLLIENRSLLNQRNNMLFEMGLLEEKLNSHENYNLFYNQSDNRYKRQITELMNFYNNEYEILPLWFKRLGHVVKVITGKRTFRSLFNDNVKKYKG